VSTPQINLMAHYDAITLLLGKIRAISCGIVGVNGDEKLCGYLGTTIFDLALEIDQHLEARFEGGKEETGEEIGIDRDFAQSIASELDAAHNYLEIAWVVMNDATRAKFTQRLKEAGWSIPDGSRVRHDARAEMLRDLQRVVYAQAEGDAA
jgi:hypothetical protein